MNKKLYEISYVQNGKDSVVYHERRFVPVTKNTATIFNTLICSFNQNHPASDRVEAIHEITTDDVASALDDLLHDFINGTLVFSADDALYVQYASEILKEC